jgi:hypothetical protein
VVTLAGYDNLLGVVYNSAPCFQSCFLLAVEVFDLKHKVTTLLDTTASWTSIPLIFVTDKVLSLSLMLFMVHITH